ncbi:unnamed protein product, partial [Hapterophycus canaliculatus]
MKYHDAGAFVSDVRLIFDNARKYNPPKHPIHVAAAKLAKVRTSMLDAERFPVGSCDSIGVGGACCSL